MRTLLLPAMMTVALAAAGAQERKLTLPDGKVSDGSAVPAPVPATKLEPELLGHLESFFGRLKEGKIEDAYKKLLEKSRIGRENSITTEFIAKTKEIFKVHGSMVDVELLKVKAVGRHLREVIYQLSCRDHPTQWRIFAYHNGTDWQILDLSVENDLSKMGS